MLILDFTTNKTKLIYTGNDLVPFNFIFINSEYGSSSTFSAVNLDKGVISLGQRGFVITSQNEAVRIDLEIPDEVFEINLLNNGIERVCSQRDFISEWIYFTYPVNTVSTSFPNQTLQYNYRDQSWGIFKECYTTYGTFRKKSGETWATIGDSFPTWVQWNKPWNAGSTTLLQPTVIAGNQQGFIVFRDYGTAESNSLYIRSLSNSTITSPDHSLQNGEYIIISGCIGTSSSELNGKIFSVANVTQNTFALNPTITSGLTYLGKGVIKKMYPPFIQTKQFPLAWNMGRKTRIGVQQYLLSTTANGQITLNIYLSQDADNAYNSGNIVPSTNVDNSSLLYSTILYTCPESTNLGLTPANVNLQMPTAVAQSQIWHRVNTSLIGDTVQLGFTLSDTQLRDIDFKSQFAEIELHSIIIDVSPSMLLS